MNNITYKFGMLFKKEDMLKLYMDAGWTNYMKDMTNLIEAAESSLYMVSAWDESELVGLIRVVGDGLTIIYIQDILVMNSHKRKGIGSELLKHVLNKYADVRQKVLLTDETEETRRFYESNGFISTDKFSSGESSGIVTFIKFN